MKQEFVIALRATVVTLVLTGLLYPAVVTGFAHVLFGDAAQGSAVENEEGQVVGSSLIGQPFSNPAYLQPRPSAAGANGYDATASSGSNLGSTSQKLRDRVTADIERLHKENPDAPELIPSDLVTASGSGLDPHLTPEGAVWQAPRIANARGIDDVGRVKQVIESMIEGRTFGVLGEPRVNVLLTNLAFDRQFGRPSKQ